jgi:hypothetical protein
MACHLAVPPLLPDTLLINDCLGQKGLQEPHPAGSLATVGALEHTSRRNFLPRPWCIWKRMSCWLHCQPRQLATTLTQQTLPTISSTTQVLFKLGLQPTRQPCNQKSMLQDQHVKESAAAASSPRSYTTMTADCCAAAVVPGSQPPPQGLTSQRCHLTCHLSMSHTSHLAGHRACRN